MPRRKRRAKSRAYNPTPDESWWLAGLPVPQELSSDTRRALGYPPRRVGDSEFEQHGLCPFCWLTHKSTSSDPPNDPRSGLSGLDRMRQLYEAAPERVRREVPPERVRILKGTATEADLAADRRRLERLLRELEWTTPWMRDWWALPEEAQRQEVGRLEVNLNRR